MKGLSSVRRGLFAIRKGSILSYLKAGLGDLEIYRFEASVVLRVELMRHPFKKKI